MRPKGDREWRITNQVTDALRFKSRKYHVAGRKRIGLFTDQIANYVRNNWHWEDEPPTNLQVSTAIRHRFNQLKSRDIPQIGSAGLVRIVEKGCCTFYYLTELNNGS